LGIVIGIVLTSVVGLAKEIIIREYNAKRDNSLRIKLIETAFEIGDNVWFKDMEREGDELCEEFDKIVQDKF
jgi:hypothetical protein